MIDSTYYVYSTQQAITIIVRIDSAAGCTPPPAGPRWLGGGGGGGARGSVLALGLGAT